MGFLPVELLKAGSVAKVVDSALLNRLGIQVARSVVAHGIYATRGVKLRGAATPEQLQTLEQDGIVTIENFLPAERFEALKKEALDLLRTGRPSVYKHGCNQLTQRTVCQKDEAPLLKALADDPRLRDLFDWGERMTVDFAATLEAVEELAQGPGEETDLETQLHSDIFFHTHKGWLYLEDVVPENAPFVYVKGSHRMPFDRLRWEYEDSVAGNRKSRRITAEEMQSRGLTETVFEAKANTLVVANVCGYHRRLRGVPGHARYGVHFSHRRNPFLPRLLGDPNKLPGLTLARKVKQSLGN